MRVCFVLFGLLAACATTDEGDPDDVLPAARPDRRGEIVAVADDASGTITVFGGNDGPIVAQIPQSVYRADTWIYTPATGWEEVDAEVHPKARGRYAATNDPTTGRMLLFGGRFRKAGKTGDYQLFADLWAFDPVARTWTELDDGAEGPAPRYHAQLAFDPVSETLYVWGGGTNESGLVLTPASDLWSWTADDGWTELSTTGDAPSTRMFTASAYDAARNRLVVFGGQVGDFTSQAYHDTYALSLDDLSWTQLHDGTGQAPSTRMHGAMFHDPPRDRYVLFAGHTDLGDANDVWAFDPEDDAWSLVWEGDTFTGEGLGCRGNPSEVPADYVEQDLSGPERRHRGMVAPLGDDLWIFGGMHSECSAWLDDTWRFDLASGVWTEVLEARSGESCLRRGDDCRCLCL